MEISILNISEEVIGNLKAFIIPKAVGQSGEYFETLDALDRVRLHYIYLYPQFDYLD